MIEKILLAARGCVNNWHRVTRSQKKLIFSHPLGRVSIKHNGD